MLLHVIWGFACGLLAWTLLEYVIHYWLGHLPRGKTLISSEHLKHHKDVLYFTPTLTKIRGAAPLLIILGAGATFLIDVWFAVGFVTAVATGWTTYEVLHQAIHVQQAGQAQVKGIEGDKHHSHKGGQQPEQTPGIDVA
jgi:hypothetical protein